MSVIHHKNLNYKMNIQNVLCLDVCFWCAGTFPLIFIVNWLHISFTRMTLPRSSVIIPTYMNDEVKLDCGGHCTPCTLLSLFMSKHMHTDHCVHLRG